MAFISEFQININVDAVVITVAELNDVFVLDERRVASSKRENESFFRVKQ